MKQTNIKAIKYEELAPSFISKLVLKLQITEDGEF